MRYAAVAVIVVLWLSQTSCFLRRNRSSQGTAEVPAQGANTAESNRSSARIFLDKGREHYQNDEDTQAIEAFREAIRLDPELAEAHFRLGLSYDALGQEKEAEDAYKKAVEAFKKYLDSEGNAEDAEAHYNLGQTYAGLHIYGEAVREYRHAVRLKPDDPAIHYDLGLALMRLAHYDEAVAAFSESLELDPENFRAEDAREEAREGVKRIRAGKKHQEDLLKKKKEAELKKLEEAGATPQTRPTPVRKPI